MSDVDFMQLALRLAKRGQGNVEPNPMVGCVIVKDARVIGRGYHRRFGGPHAEVNALAACRQSPRSATAYVTLEPCSYHGKTPPCVDALIAAGIERVVAAVPDPNPQVNGQGFERLRAAGIAVTVGVGAEQASELIAPFKTLMLKRRPWIILKWAQSLDGKIATHTGDSKWISDTWCRRHAHRVRGRMDAIIVGAETVLRDDPMLTARTTHPRRIAQRVVLDRRLRTPLAARLVTTARQFPTLIYCSGFASPEHRNDLTRAGCEVVTASTIEAVLDDLAQRGCTNVLVEGGGAVLGGFFDAGLADEVHCYLTPRLIGGRDATSALGGQGVLRVADGMCLRHAELRKLGGGWLLEARTAAVPDKKRCKDPERHDFGNYANREDWPNNEQV